MPTCVTEPVHPASTGELRGNIRERITAAARRRATEKPA